MSRYIAVIFGVIIAAAALSIFLFREDDAAYVLRVRKLDERWREVAQKTVADIVGSSTLKNDFAFNEARGDHPIAFFLFDSRLSKMRSSKARACGYYPTSKSVFCDVSFIDAFLSQRDLDKKIVPFEGNRPIDQPFDLEPLTPEEHDVNRLFLLQWVLGHEFGHFLARHQASYFAPTSLEARVEAKSVSQANEIEADAFLASHYDPNVGPGVQFYQNLIYLLNVEVHRKACPGLSPLQYCDKIQFGVGIYSPATAVYFKTDGTHPEYVIRLVRLLKEAHQRYDLGAIGYLNDTIVNSFQEQDRGGQTCLIGVICW